MKNGMSFLKKIILSAAVVFIAAVGMAIPASANDGDDAFVTQNGAIVCVYDGIELTPETQEKLDCGEALVIYRITGMNGWDSYRIDAPNEYECPCDVRVMVVTVDEFVAYTTEEDKFSATVKLEKQPGIMVHYERWPEDLSEEEVETIQKRLTASSSDYTGIVQKDGDTICVEDEVKLDADVYDKIDFSSSLYLIYRKLGENGSTTYTLGCPTASEVPCDVRVVLVTAEEFQDYEESGRYEAVALDFERKPGVTLHYVTPQYEAALDNNGQLKAICKYCGRVSAATVDLSVSEGDKICTHTTVRCVVTANNDATFEPKLVYMTGKKSSLEAPTTATSAGTKYKIGITTNELWTKYQAGEKTLAEAVGSIVNVTYKSHWWEQSYNDYSFSAKCTSCEKEVSVRLDTTAIYDASRRGETTGLNYSYFVDEGWSDEELLPEYHMIYDGYMTEDDGSTTKLVNVYAQPSKPGNYTVKIALLNRRGKITAETKEKTYYIADFSMESCEVLDYGPRQIELFTEPQSTTDESGAKHYSVGTKSELLWCSYNAPTDKPIYITLTNDIVLNPITVSYEGKVRSALLQIYRWKGFGSNDSPAQVIFDGQGFKIYGMYAEDQIHPVGLVAVGKNSSVKDLTIENAKIYGLHAGAFFGDYVETADCRGVVLENCTSQNNYIEGGAYAGGFIGNIVNDPKTNNLPIGYLSLNDLTNRSRVHGNYAGGIVGALTEGSVSVYFNRCVNIETVSAGLYAGGIVGWFGVLQFKDYRFNDCLNHSDIYGSRAAGGIVGSLGGIYTSSGSFVSTSDELYNQFTMNFTNSSCFSGLHTDNGTATQGPIIGAFGEYDATKALRNMGFYDCARKGCGWGQSAIPESTCPLLADNAVACSIYGHIACNAFSDVTFASCTESGSWNLKCFCCGTTILTSNCAPHGHVYDYNEDAEKVCVYCGQAEPEEAEEGTASLFSQKIYIFGAVAVVALIALAIVWVIVKKKKQKKNQ